MEKMNELFEKRWTIMNRAEGKIPKETAFSYFRAGWILAQGEEDEVIPQGFEYFWNLYDKKVGKDKSMKLWNKLSATEKSQCLAYIPCYKMAQPDKKYRKNPETFLRNKSWRDELIYQNDGNEQDKIRAILGI